MKYLGLVNTEGLWNVSISYLEYTSINSTSNVILGRELMGLVSFTF